MKAASAAAADSAAAAADSAAEAAAAGSAADGPNARYSVPASDCGLMPVSITSTPGICDPEAA